VSDALPTDATSVEAILLLEDGPVRLLFDDFVEARGGADGYRF
jgi:hypothetical protein